MKGTRKMRYKKKITPHRVKYWLVWACMASLSIGALSGWLIGKSSLNGKIEPITAIQESEPIVESEKPAYKNIGTFKLTAYCSCERCCGKSDGITATGAKVEPGVTIAVDPDIIPYGTEVMINGHTYIAQDTMAQKIKDYYNGKIIDIYFENHADALAFGVQESEIYIPNEEVIG